MILWHTGLAAAITYFTLGRRRIDYRFVLLGAIAPDIIDAFLSHFAFSGWHGRGVSHSIVAVVVVAVVILVTTSGTRRLSLFGIAVGWLLHLVGDAMWDHPRTFLWPAFGFAFAEAPEPYSIALFTRPLDHLLAWIGELVGFMLLAWFWVAFELGRGGRGRRFLRDGHLRA